MTDEEFSVFREVEIDKMPGYWIGITIGRAAIRISEKAFAKIGNPGCIKIFVDEEDKRLSIKPAKSDEDNSMRITPRGTYYTDDTLAINGPKLIDAISEKLSLIFTDKIARYRIPGVYDKEQRALIFDTADAEAVPKKERKSKGTRTLDTEEENLPAD